LLNNVADVRELWRNRPIQLTARRWREICQGAPSSRIYDEPSSFGVARSGKSGSTLEMLAGVSLYIVDVLMQTVRKTAFILGTKTQANPTLIMQRNQQRMTSFTISRSTSFGVLAPPSTDRQRSVPYVKSLARWGQFYYLKKLNQNFGVAATMI